MPDPVLGPVTALDVCTITTFGTLYAQRIMSTFRYVAVPPVGATPGDRWAAYASIRTAFTASGGILEALTACQTINLTQNYLRAQIITGDGTRKIYREWPIGQTGARDEPAGTANTAASIERRSSTVGPHGIGRLQIAGVPSTDYTAGILSIEYIALMTALATEMLTSVVDAGGTTWAPCLAYTTPGGITASIIIGCMPKSTLRNMSRRTVGRGE